MTKKELESLLGAIHHSSKYFKNLSSKRQPENIMVKSTKMGIGKRKKRRNPEPTKDKKQILNLAHCNPNQIKIVTTDAKTHGFGAIL